MKKIIIWILMLILLVGVVSAIQSISSFQIVDYAHNDTTNSVKVAYNSPNLNKTMAYYLEGTKRFDDCKKANGLLYGYNGKYPYTLSFNCTDYTNHSDYLQKKITETELMHYNITAYMIQYEGYKPEVEELETRVTLLETLFDIITDILARLGIIEKDIEEGFTGTCPDGVIINKGIVTECV